MEKCPPYQAIFTKVSRPAKLLGMSKLHGLAAAAALILSQYFMQHRALQPRQGKLILLLLSHVRTQ